MSGNVGSTQALSLWLLWPSWSERSKVLLNKIVYNQRYPELVQSSIESHDLRSIGGWRRYSWSTRKFCQTGHYLYSLLSAQYHIYTRLSLISCLLQSAASLLHSPQPWTSAGVWELSGDWDERISVIVWYYVIHWKVLVRICPGSKVVLVSCCIWYQHQQPAPQWGLQTASHHHPHQLAGPGQDQMDLTPPSSVARPEQVLGMNIHTELVTS